MFEFGFLLQLLLRRLHYIILLSLPVVVIGVWLAVKLPPIYSAQARLLVESPQVPTELAASTLRLETTEILRVLEQRLLARGSVLALSRRLGLHADRPEMTADQIVADMRRRISISLPGHRDVAAFVSIAFDSPDPQVSAEVVGHLVTQLTSDFATLRTQSTRQTSEFFDVEVERLQQLLNDQRARVLAFQEQNMEALPDSLAYRRTRQTALQERLLQIDREIDRLSDRRDRIVLLFEQTGQMASSLVNVSPEQAELRRLRVALSEARSVFAPTHPQPQSLERRIAALEAEIGGAADTDGEARPHNQLTLELADIDGQVEFLNRQKRQVEEELSSLEQSIAATPAIAVTLSALQRDLDNTQAEYSNAIARRSAARIGERVEAQSQGRRLTVVEPPVPPTAPTKPNRPLIAAAGSIAGVAFGIGLVGLLELLNTSVRRPIDIVRTLGVQPFATLPMLRTRREIVLRRTTIGATFVISALAISFGVWFVDQYYLPVPIIVDRVMDRTGFGLLFSQLFTLAR